MRNRSSRMAVAVLSTVFALSAAAPALAFDGGTHSELTADAMTAEGFGPDATGLAQVNNWFVDLYEQAALNPYSGHAGFFKRLLSGVVSAERWSDAVVAAAWPSHFDNSEALFNTAGVTAECDRLRRAIWSLTQEAREQNDPAMLVAVIGMSLHQIQDFYAHTNWVEPRDAKDADGPGWQERGFGSSPTWFDIPAAVRDAAHIYSDESHGNREHGYWNTDGNNSLITAMNKDWPGRPYYKQAAMSAYFASRQWIQAMRLWVGDDAFWTRAQQLRADRSQLNHDLSGAFTISLYLGHWQGQGEPLGGKHGLGGSLPDVRRALEDYFHPKYRVGPRGPKSIYRARFESLITRMAEPDPTGHLGPIPSSQEMQRSTKFVVLRVLSMRGEGLGDPGPDDADMYATVGIGGQTMKSAVIHGRDQYAFPQPSEPFTWMKAVPAVGSRPEPVQSIEIEVETGNKRSAGTNDAVFLRLGPNLRFQLDKRLYDDFERGDLDTYSVPIDAAVRAGLNVGELTQLRIEKAGDGLGGGWRLGGVKLRVNGAVVYEARRIDRWLSGSQRTWSAPDFLVNDPHGAKIPIWLQLDEDDSFYGGDDNGDINPYGHRRVASTSYAPGPPLQLTSKGGNRLGGRLGDDNEASIAYSLETITPEIIRPADRIPPADRVPPPPGTKYPDLVITAFDLNSVTVKNQGDGDAGPFRVRLANDTIEQTETFRGLKAGASETRTKLLLPCEYFLSSVDDLHEVIESNEANNTTNLGDIFC
jgi:hypothetical protein